jgi:hypothetical protein
MTVRCGGEGRYLYVLLLLCLLLVAQSAAFASANEQHHSTDHCCLLCHVGPLPFVHTHSSAVVMPNPSRVWLEPSPDFVATHDVFLSTTSSRGPPAPSSFCI